jgi:hypothetical protein
MFGVQDKGPPAGPDIGQRRDRQTHVLLLCEDDDFAYRVLRATAAAGARVSVLARGRGGRLRFSRCTDKLQRTRDAFDTTNPALIDLIDRLAIDWKIDIVAPTNATTTRYLCAVRERLAVRVVPLPGPGLFDELNDKWRFTLKAARLGLSHPTTRLFADSARLRAALERELGGQAGVVKPLSACGGRGVHRIGPGGSSAAPGHLRYAPILWQAFVPGRSVSASAFCLDGEVLTFLVYSRRAGVYEFSDAPAVRREAEAIVRHTGYSGLVNFDLIARPDGGHVWLECNPRVFFTIEDQAVAGANFMTPALALNAVEREAAVAAFDRVAAGLTGRRLRKLRASAWALASGAGLTDLDRGLAAHALSDPGLLAWNRLRELARRISGFVHGARRRDLNEASPRKTKAR